MWATLVSLLVSLVAVVLVLAALRVPLPAVAAAGVRGWMWSGGLLGAFYITAALVLAPRLGAAASSPRWWQGRCWRRWRPTGSAWPGLPCAN